MKVSSKTVLICLGSAPVYAALTEPSSGSAVVLMGAYALSWAARYFARRRDPDEKAFTELFSTRFGRSLLIAFLVAIQLVALHLSAQKSLAGGMLAVSAVFIVWSTASSPQVFKGRLQGLTASAVATLISLLVLEGSLRLLHSRRPPNDYRSVTWGHPVVNNSLGFREREFVVPKPVDVFRIMVLGDSLTWGAALPAESRYSELLEASLRQRLPQRNIEVLNFGVAGGPTTAERDILVRYIDEVEPDFVVIGFCINDPQTRDQDYAIELDKFGFLFTGFETLGTLGLVRTANFLRHTVNEGTRRLGFVPHWMDALDRVYLPSSLEWRQFERALQDIQRVTASHGLPAPVFAPLLYFDGDYRRPNDLIARVVRWTEIASSAARAAGLDVVQMNDIFESQGFQVRAVLPWDLHPSADTNRVYGMFLAEELGARIEAIPPTPTDIGSQ